MKTQGLCESLLGYGSGGWGSGLSLQATWLGTYCALSVTAFTCSWDRRGGAFHCSEIFLTRTADFKLNQALCDQLLPEEQRLKRNE